MRMQNTSKQTEQQSQEADNCSYKEITKTEQEALAKSTYLEHAG